MLFVCKRYFQKVIFSLAVMILFAPASYAATFTSVITTPQTFTEDTEIIVTSFPAWPNMDSAINATSGQFTSIPGVVVSIDIDIPGGAWYNAIGAYGANTLVSLDRVYINAGHGGSAASTSRGIHAESGAVVKIGDDSEIYSNNNGFALNAIADGKIEVGDNAMLYGTLFSNGGGVVNAINGQIIIGDGAVISNDGYAAENAYGAAYGYYHNAVVAAGNASNAGSVVIGNDAQIAAGSTGRYNYGLQAGIDSYNLAGTITVGDNATIDTYGAAYNYGLFSTLSGSVITIGSTSQVTSRGINSIGAFAQSGGEINIGSDSRITTYGDEAYGAYSYLGGHINIGQGSTILTYYKNSAGLVANGAANASTINTSDDVTIETHGGEADGVWAYSATYGDEAHITLGKNNNIIIHGSDSFGLFASGPSSFISADSELSILTFDEGSYAICAYSGGEVSIGASAIVTTSGDEAFGVYAVNGGVVDIKEGAKIITMGSGSIGVYAEDGGKVELYGAEIAVGAASDYAIMSHSSNTSTSNSIVSGNGIFKITGDIIAQADSSGAASVDLVMQDNSLFTGATELYGGAAEINFSLNGSGTLWDVTEDSQLTSLYMSGATVDMMNTNGDATLTMANLGASASDTGIFKMDTNIPLETADMLVITDTAQGSYLIRVRNDGSQAATGTEITNLVRAVGAQPVSFLLENDVESGGWQYGLHYEDGSVAGGLGAEDTWSLRATGKASSSGSAAINNFAGSYLMTYATMQTLIQRMGDLRDSPYDQGVWFRAHGGKFESNSKSYVRGFDMKYGGVQIGYDRRIDNEWNGRLYAGVMFDYSKGDLDYSDEGSGTVNSKALGVYGTFIASTGWYVDAVLKYQWMDNDFDVIDTAGALVSGGEISTGGFGASIEAGKRIHLGETKVQGVKGGWYVEPQLQLSYQHHDGGYFNASNGLHIGTDSFKSLLGRIGVLVGYETGERNFYAKVSRVKEFDGDLTARANGVVIDESFGDSWWVYGLGITSKVNDRNSFYLDIERTSGGSFRQPWRINGGWRIEF